MRIVLQRVASAGVAVGGEIVGGIGPGLVLLVGIHKADTAEKLPIMRDKLLNMRIFHNEDGKFDRSLLDIKGDVLLIPQFTLFADTSKGRRPEFFEAMRPPEASKLFDQFVALWRDAPVGKVAAGVFGAEMDVELINHGPVTIIVEN